VNKLELIEALKAETGLTKNRGCGRCKPVFYEIAYLQQSVIQELGDFYPVLPIKASQGEL